MKTHLHESTYDFRYSHNDAFDVIVDMGERSDPKTLKDIRFSESPREAPTFRDELGSRPAPQQPQVTAKETHFLLKIYCVFNASCNIL